MNACFTPSALVLAFLAPAQLDALCRTLHASAAERNTVPLTAYLFVFILNCLLEAPGYCLPGRLIGRGYREIARQIVVLNLATHPLVYYGFPYVAEVRGWSLLTMVALAEVFAFSVEAILLRRVWRYSWRTAILASTAANLTSWWVGAILYDAGLEALL